MDTEKKRSHLTRCAQLKANLKLHFLRKVRRPFGTLVEIILPLCFSFMALYMPPADEHYTRDITLTFTQFPIFLTFFMTLLLPFFLRAIVEEKEADLKGLMTIMGLKKSIYWLGWIMTYSVLAFLVALIGAASVVSKVYTFTSYGPWFILMLVYMLSVIAMGCMLSTLQTKSTVSYSHLWFMVDLLQLYCIVVLFFSVCCYMGPNYNMCYCHCNKISGHFVCYMVLVLYTWCIF